MQSDNTTMGSVTITDARQTKPQAPVVEKPKETPEEKLNWDKAREKALSRMRPEKKEDKPADDKAKSAEKVVSEDMAANAAKAEELKEKTKAKSTAEKKDAPAEDKEKVVKETTEKNEDKPKPEPKAKKDEPAVDYEKLATTVARETAKAIKESEKKETKTDKPEDEVPEARKRDLAAIEYLEANNPRYKGKKSEYVKFAKSEADYVAKWERDNPGLKFDSDADEHGAFYDKHEPDIDPDDISEARIELAAERRAKALIEKETGSTKQQLESLRMEREVEKADAAVPEMVNLNLAIVASSLSEDVAKLVGEGKSLEESDPAAHAAILDTMKELGPQTQAAVRIFSTNGRAYDAKNPSHVAVAKEAMELEKVILSKTDAERTMEDGRTYVSLDEYAALDEAGRSKHWTINAKLMSLHLGNKAAEKAAENYKSKREQAEKYARAYGYVKNGESATAQNGKHVEAEEAEQEQEKPRSPSTATKTVIQPGTKVDPKTSLVGAEKMFRRLGWE